MLNLIFDENGNSPAEYSIMMGVTIVVATAMVVSGLGEKLQDSFARANNLFP